LKLFNTKRRLAKVLRKSEILEVKSYEYATQKNGSYRFGWNITQE